ncbi:MAG: zf-TFIIB domain-containing protein [Myxococcales bacterium]
MVTTRALKELLASAKDKPGKCKECGVRLERVAECPKCHTPSPACPECGHAPLSIGVTRGVELDVCMSCGGIWLDGGELQLLAGGQGKAQEIQRRADEVAGRSEGPQRTICASCNRELRRNHAFEADGSIYCGTCAPTGASPVVAELTPERPIVTHHHHHHDHHGHWHDDCHTSIDLVAFFRSLF